MAGYKKARRKIEKTLGRKLTVDEVVHHKDRNPSNDDLRNLEVLTRHEHNVLHFKGKNALDKWRRKNRP